MMPSLSEANDRIARDLGPDAYDPPVMWCCKGKLKPCEPHPFLVVRDNHFCGRCGGGLLHAVHSTEAQEAA